MLNVLKKRNISVSTRKFEDIIKASDYLTKALRLGAIGIHGRSHGQVVTAAGRPTFQQVKIKRLRFTMDLPALPVRLIEMVPGSPQVLTLSPIDEPRRSIYDRCNRDFLVPVRKWKRYGRSRVEGVRLTAARKVNDARSRSYIPKTSWEPGRESSKINPFSDAETAPRTVSVRAFCRILRAWCRVFD